MEHSRKKIFHWKWEAKLRSQYLFVGSCSEAEILQDLILHDKVCVEREKFWFGALLEKLFHILERKYTQNNAHLWEQKFILLLLLIKNIYKYPGLIRK